MAHKKAAGAAKNLRDSQPKYRGVKLFGGQKHMEETLLLDKMDLNMNVEKTPI